MPAEGGEERPLGINVIRLLFMKVITFDQSRWRRRYYQLCVPLAVLIIVYGLRVVSDRSRHLFSVSAGLMSSAQNLQASNRFY